jgi:abortive infection bacteriophage resistance protein
MDKKIYTLKKNDPATYLKAQYACGLGTPSVLSEAECIAIINDMGLFKFKGYLYVFKNELAGRSVDDILMLYGFDRHLSKHLMDLSLRVEAKLKAALVESAYLLTDNPFFYLDAASYNGDFSLSHQENSDWTPRDKKGKTEVYRHYRDYYMETYDFEKNRKKYLDATMMVTEAEGVNFPPFHYFIESATIGTVIAMILKLEVGGIPLTKAVSGKFGFFLPEVFQSYILRLKEVRNRCAHNGRIFNRNYRGVKGLKPYRHFFNASAPHKIIHAWITLSYLLGELDTFDGYGSFEKDELFHLFKSFKSDRPSNMMLKNLPNKYEMKKWVELSNFILRGMGKK